MATPNTGSGVFDAYGYISDVGGSSFKLSFSYVSESMMFTEAPVSIVIFIVVLAIFTEHVGSVLVGVFVERIFSLRYGTS